MCNTQETPTSLEQERRLSVSLEREQIPQVHAWFNGQGTEATSEPALPFPHRLSPHPPSPLQYFPAAITDSADGEMNRGLLDAPIPKPSENANTTSVPRDEVVGSPLEDNLLVEDEQEAEQEQEQVGGAAEDGGLFEERVGLLTTETRRGARLAVEDVSVVTPTGKRRTALESNRIKSNRTEPNRTEPSQVLGPVRV